jgi:hypothetical protein
MIGPDDFDDETLLAWLRLTQGTDATRADREASKLFASLVDECGPAAAHEAFRKVLAASSEGRGPGRRVASHARAAGLWLALYDRRPKGQTSRAFARALAASPDGRGLCAKTIEHLMLRFVRDRRLARARVVPGW